jgi:hypothetical protein
MRKLRFPLLALALLASACTPSAIDVANSRLKEFTPGQAHYADVTGKLGLPKIDMREDNGGRVVIYDYAVVSTTPPDRDPPFPWRERGDNVRTTSVALSFSPDGTLRYWRADATGRGQ